MDRHRVMRSAKVEAVGAVPAIERQSVMRFGANQVRVAGLPEGANPMHFIMIVREFTGVGLAEAKAYLDCLTAGESLVLVPYESGKASAFVEKLLRFKAVCVAEVAAA
jgi:ribosomal protein L7/L12